MSDLTDKATAWDAVAEKNVRIAELEREVARLEKIREIQQAAMDRYRPCSDHNGNVNPASKWECQWCLVEREKRKIERIVEVLDPRRPYSGLSKDAATARAIAEGKE